MIEIQGPKMIFFFFKNLPIEKVNLNNGLHLEGWWIGVVEQFKNSPNKDYLTLDFLNVKKLLFQQLFNKAQHP